MSVLTLFTLVMVAVSSQLWTGLGTQQDADKPAGIQDRLYRVQDNGIRCIAAPCFSYDAQIVNTTETITVSDVDLSHVRATPEQHAAATQAMSTRSLLVSGTIQVQSGAAPAGDGRVLVANQYYLPASGADGWSPGPPRQP